MSRKIQERPIVFPSGGGKVVCEGLYHKGDRGAAGLVVGAPHPRFGGSMHSPVVAEIAYAGARDGRPTLRFNYRGVGGSQGFGTVTDTDWPGEREDYLAAIEELRATANRAKTIAAGYSFGAAVALDIALTAPDIAGAVLVAPPTKSFPFDRLKDLRVPTLVIAGSDDDHVDWPTLRTTCAGVAALQLETIANADHFFGRGLTDLGRTIQSFLEKVSDL